MVVAVKTKVEPVAMAVMVVIVADSLLMVVAEIMEATEEMVAMAEHRVVVMVVMAVMVA